MPETSINHPSLNIVWLGFQTFEQAYSLQKSLLKKRTLNKICDTLLLLEHPHVYTLGKRSDKAEILADDDELFRSGVRIIKTDRGGRTTYHGPGQLVGYLIMDLRAAEIGPIEYVRRLEKILIGVLQQYGIEGHRIKGRTGVWTNGPLDQYPAKNHRVEEKIAAIGIRVSRGVAMHGFSLNVSPDLTYFNGIVPCGLQDVQVTSIKRILGNSDPVEQVGQWTAKEVARSFEMELHWVELEIILS